jgi:pimeloyl-ACP methyl ester carboxylesterase
MGGDNMITGKYIEINGTDIYYETRGSGIPIFIIHGWSVDHKLMSGPMEKFFANKNKGFKRVYIDLPGMGKSSVNPKVRTADDVLDILLRFIDEVIPNTPFLLMGESWGGALCRGILKHKKADVLGLCLLCPVSISGAKNIPIPKRTVIEKDEAFLASLSGKERASFTSLAVAQTKKFWKAFKRDVYRTLLNL